MSKPLSFLAFSPLLFSLTLYLLCSHSSIFKALPEYLLVLNTFYPSISNPSIPFAIFDFLHNPVGGHMATRLFLLVLYQVSHPWDGDVQPVLLYIHLSTHYVYISMFTIFLLYPPDMVHLYTVTLFNLRLWYYISW